MFSKSFVSIYFLPDRVLILQLAGNRKKVSKYGHVVLPEELIKDGRVQNIDSLSKVISSAWDKLHIKGKTVGVVIPESSVFTKYFKLPGLSVTEIDEAVRWQAQEYLPAGLDNMLLDWKISAKNDSGIEVMTVAVDKDILSEYVKVIEKAGLYPMKVETPSICLLRFSEKHEGGNLVIYKNFKETILVISEGKKIIGTSIQHADDFENVLKSASKMLNHYSDVKVDKVLIGGENSKEDLEKTAAFLKRKVLLIDPAIGGIDGETQKYLIPISTQLEDIEQPSDPTTLNLLPAELVDKYKTERQKVQVWSITLTITLFVWMSFFVVLVSYLFMTQSIADLKERFQESDKNVVDKLDPLQEVESINAISQSVLKIKNITVAPQTVLNEVYSSKPVGIAINNYDLNMDKGDIILQGVSVDRKTLIQFKENLEKLESVDKVDIPISSFEEETDLEFTLSYSYLPVKSTVKEKTIKVNQGSLLK